MGFWGDLAIADDPTERSECRVSAMTRRELLVERLPDTEFLRDLYLDDNNFRISSVLGSWALDDLGELDEIDNLLRRIDRLDGPSTACELQAVKDRLAELDREFPLSEN